MKIRRSLGAITAAIVAGILTTGGTLAEPPNGEEAEEQEQQSTESPQQTDSEADPDTETGGGYMGRSQREMIENEDVDPLSRAAAVPVPLGVQGVDVSHHNGTVDWKKLWNEGKRFTFIKATEGQSYSDPRFSVNLDAAKKAGFLHGAYHFARPDVTTARRQAQHFVENGGGWTADGSSLPGVLDVEGPYFNFEEKPTRCWGKNREEMVTWIKDFLAEYKNLTGRDAIIYTSPSWWSECTGNSNAFSSSTPLWLANWTGTYKPLPAKWRHYTFWQYTDQPQSPNPMDQNSFNGTFSQLKSFASNGSFKVSPPKCPPGDAYTTVIPSNKFCDVPEGHAFATEISWLIDQGIAEGWDDSSFRPLNRISREAMAAFLYRWAGEPDFEAPNNSPFNDVDTNYTFYREIAWLHEQDIAEGWDDDTYRPLNRISREATAAFLYRLDSSMPGQ